MALIHCPECQHEISTLATTCPNCGYPLQPLLQTRRESDPEIAYLVKEGKQWQEWRENKQVSAVIAVVILLFVLVIIFAASLSVSQTPQYQTCTYGTPGIGAYSSLLTPAGTPCP